MEDRGDIFKGNKRSFFLLPILRFHSLSSDLQNKGQPGGQAVSGVAYVCWPNMVDLLDIDLFPFFFCLLRPTSHCQPALNLNWRARKKEWAQFSMHRLPLFSEKPRSAVPASQPACLQVIRLNRRQHSLDKVWSERKFKELYFFPDPGLRWLFS